MLFWIVLVTDMANHYYCAKLSLNFGICIFPVLFASNESPMYKSLTKTKKYSELEAHETLKRAASANAIIKHYKSSSLITVKRHAMVLSFL